MPFYQMKSACVVYNNLNFDRVRVKSRYIKLSTCSLYDNILNFVWGRHLYANRDLNPLVNDKMFKIEELCRHQIDKMTISFFDK